MSHLLPILQSKLMAPRQTGVFLRPETVRRFAEGAQRRLLVVKAPAGYGKTTATAFVAEESGWRVAWYTLDRLDTDPIAFIRTLVSSVRQQVPDFAAKLHERLRQPAQLDTIEALALLTSAMESELDHDLRIVLDDFQEAGSEDVCVVLDYLLAAQGCPARFVILTRHDPALHTSKLRLADEMAEIGPEDLRFTDRQSQKVVKRLSGRELSTQDLQELMDISEGWPASVVLFGRFIMSRSQDALDDPRLKGDLFSYLAEQAYDRQTPDIQAFLRLSCCLEHMTPELATAATGLSEAPRHLAYLSANAVFTFQIEGGRYRYHRLFRDYLRHRATEEDGIEAYRTAQLRAAHASEVVGDTCGAIELYLDAGDTESVMRLLAESGDVVLEQATTSQLTRWHARIQGATKNAAAWRALLEGHLRHSHADFDVALSLVREAHSRFVELGDARGSYLAATAIERAQFWKGDYAAAASACLDALQTCTAPLERAHLLNSLAAARTSMCQWDLAEEAHREVLQLIDDPDSPERTRVECQQWVALGNRGRFAEAVVLGERLWPRVKGLMPSLFIQSFLNVSAQWYLQTAEYERALARLDEADVELRRHGSTECEPLLQETRGELMAARGDLDAARQLLRSAVNHPAYSSDLECRALALSHLGTALRRTGDMHGAQAAYEEALGLVDGLPSQNARLTCVTNDLFVKCMLQPDHSLTPLLECERQALECDLLLVSHKAATFFAIVTDARGGREQALACLEKTTLSALELGQRHFLAQDFATVPTLLMALFAHLTDEHGLSELASAVAAHPRARQLLSRALDCGERAALAALQAATERLPVDQAQAIAERASRSKSSIVRRRAAEVMAGTGRRTSPFPELTPREAEVLRLIATGLRNQEIAEQLVLETGTVKTYVNRIFTKLGFADRVQATLYYHRAVDENATR